MVTTEFFRDHLQFPRCLDVIVNAETSFAKCTLDPHYIFILTNEPNKIKKRLQDEPINNNTMIPSLKRKLEGTA